MTVSIRKFWIFVLVLNQIEHWSNYSIRFEIPNIRTSLVTFITLLCYVTWNWKAETRWQRWMFDAALHCNNVTWLLTFYPKTYQFLSHDAPATKVGEIPSLNTGDIAKTCCLGRMDRSMDKIVWLPTPPWQYWTFSPCFKAMRALDSSFGLGSAISWVRRVWNAFECNFVRNGLVKTLVL